MLEELLERITANGQHAADIVLAADNPALEDSADMDVLLDLVMGYVVPLSMQGQALTEEQIGALMFIVKGAYFLGHKRGKTQGILSRFAVAEET